MKIVNVGQGFVLIFRLALSEHCLKTIVPFCHAEIIKLSHLAHWTRVVQIVTLVELLCAQVAKQFELTSRESG